jgi:hypothetical protein
VKDVLVILSGPGLSRRSGVVSNMTGMQNRLKFSIHSSFTLKSLLALQNLEITFTIRLTMRQHGPRPSFSFWSSLDEEHPSHSEQSGRFCPWFSANLAPGKIPKAWPGIFIPHKRVERAAVSRSDLGGYTRTNGPYPPASEVVPSTSRRKNSSSLNCRGGGRGFQRSPWADLT